MTLENSNFGFLREVVDQAWDEVLIVDVRSETIVYANKTAQQNLKLEKGALSLPIAKIIGTEHSKQIFSDFKNNSISANNDSIYEVRMRRMDNSSYPAKVKCSMQVDGESELLLLNFTDITEKQKTERQLSYLANYDALTGLPNRNLFFEHLQTAMHHTQRNQTLAALLYLDLNNFKSIIDQQGHELGDHLLREVGKRLLRSVRKTDTVSRLGGDEFALVLSHVKSIIDINFVVDKILSNMREPFILNGKQLFVSASIGISVYPFNETDDCYELLRQADAAMYKAKEQEGNSYSYYSVDISLAELRRNKMEAALQMALKRKEFEIYYQPRVTLEDGRIVGAEALLRWTHPELGFVSPMEFIPVLESTGLISEVGKWVLESGCMQLKAWSDKGYDLRLSVNVSGQQFSRGNFSEVLEEALKKSDVIPETLEVEITEGVLINNHEEATSILADIRKKGVKISLDDFGTGYSSLTYLKQFPIDILKIDRSFVMDLLHNKASSVIVETIIGLAKNMSLQVTAEGIEELEHANFLNARQCDEGQGFYYGKPMPGFEFEQMLIEQEVSEKRSGRTH